MVPLESICKNRWVHQPDNNISTTSQNPFRASSCLSLVSITLIPLLSLVCTGLLLVFLIILQVIVVNDLRFGLCQHQEFKYYLTETQAGLNVTRFPTSNKVDVDIESFEASNSVPSRASHTSLVNANWYTCSKGLALAYTRYECEQPHETKSAETKLSVNKRALADQHLGLTQVLCQVDSSSCNDWNLYTRSDEAIDRMHRIITNSQNPLRASSFLTWISISLIPLISLVPTWLLLEFLFILPILFV